MELKQIEGRLTVCKLKTTAEIDLKQDFYFVGRTDEEISLVCKTENTPTKTLERDDGWRAFRKMVCWKVASARRLPVSMMLTG